MIKIEELIASYYNPRQERASSDIRFKKGDRFSHNGKTFLLSHTFRYPEPVYHNLKKKQIDYVLVDEETGEFWNMVRTWGGQYLEPTKNVNGNMFM